MSNVPIDFLGKEITVGTTIVYPVRRGSSMWLKQAKVTGIEPRDRGFVLIGYDPSTPVQRRVQVRNVNTCVIVEVNNGTV